MGVPKAVIPWEFSGTFRLPTHTFFPSSWMFGGEIANNESPSTHVRDLDVAQRRIQEKILGKQASLSQTDGIFLPI